MQMISPYRMVARLMNIIPEFDTWAETDESILKVIYDVNLSSSFQEICPAKT